MRTFCLLLIVATSLAAVAADNPETVVEISQAKARAVLDKSVAAMGGAEALRGIESVKLTLSGKQWPRLQMPTPEPPFSSSTFQETLLFDLKANRLLLEQRTEGFGFQGHANVVLKGGEGTTYDMRARTSTPIPAAQASQQQFIQYYRRLPNLILRQALERANSLRYLGEGDFDSRKHEVITFVMPDTQQVALYVDSKTSLVSKYELAITDALAGDDVSEIIYADYKTSGNTKVPQRWLWRIAGDSQAEYQVAAEFNVPVTDSTFTVADSGFTRVDPAPNAPPERVEKLADGVYVIHNVAGANQNTLAVEFADYILAVEAPGTSGGADNVIRRIKETIPSKPIRYVAMTHHHGDHIGGLRSFIAEGAAVVTTPGNRKVVETMAGAVQNDRLSKNPRKAELVLIEKGKRVFTDGAQTVELIDIGPHPHAREMVIAYLPKQKIIFQGDLFFIPNNNAPFGPPQASTLSFARSVAEKKLDAEWIASVHGATGTMADLRRATGENVASQ
jgi:glyoxylase-like metal-dependent hydrolase (beta-lactamase superfamily II)